MESCLGIVMTDKHMSQKQRPQLAGTKKSSIKQKTPQTKEKESITTTSEANKLSKLTFVFILTVLTILVITISTYMHFGN